MLTEKKRKGVKPLLRLPGWTPACLVVGLPLHLWHTRQRQRVRPRARPGQLPPVPKPPNTSLESEFTKSRGLTPFTFTWAK